LKSIVLFVRVLLAVVLVLSLLLHSATLACVKEKVKIQL
jgi:hypothetical protein